MNAYSSRTTSLTKQIASMQTRIDNYTAALRKQFTALDAQVNAYRSQAASMNSLTGAGAADSTGKNGIL
jgi:flagellar capping protein FliD